MLISLKKPTLLLLFCIAVFLAKAQHLYHVTGVINDSGLNTALTDVIVMATVNGKQYYSISDGEGRYSLDFLSRDSTGSFHVFLLVKLIGYGEKEQQFIISKKQTLLLAIFLQSKIINLSEVIVINKPIVKKGDTTIFTVSAFSNKLDVNLEDVLKKMPGMDVLAYSHQSVVYGRV